MKNRTLLIVGIFSLAACLALITFQGQAGVYAQSQVRLTPTRTRRVTPTIKKTPTPLANHLQNQLVFSVGGGGAGNYCTTQKLEQLDHYPAIAPSAHTHYPGEFQRPFFPVPVEFVTLCIYGLPLDQGFLIELYQPDGSLESAAEYQLGEWDENMGRWILTRVDQQIERSSGIAGVDDGIPIIELDLWLPPGKPGGQWSVSVYAADDFLGGSFYLPEWEAVPLVELDQPPKYYFPYADPLGDVLSSYIDFSANVGERKQGNSLRLYGAEFKPGSTTPIGIYRRKQDPFGEIEQHYYLIDQLQAVSNRRGEWQASYSIRTSEPAGDILVIVALDPTTQDGYHTGPAVSFSIPEWKPCPNTYASRLSAGMAGMVNEEFPAKQRIRAAASTSAAIIGGMEAGEVFEILDGPQCAGNWIWWYVRTSGGLAGWTAEGDKNQRWLLPAE